MKIQNNVRGKLLLVETLILAIPILTLSYIFCQSGYTFEYSHLILFAMLILLVLAGLIVVRQIFDGISNIALSLSKVESGSTVVMDMRKDVDEFHDISTSFNNLVRELKETTAELKQKSLELVTIKEMTEKTKEVSNIDDLLNILLEKSMSVTGAQIGSVFMVEDAPRYKNLVLSGTQTGSVSDHESIYRFRVVAAKGHYKRLWESSVISIRNYAARHVLLTGKSLLIEDIEKDTRTLKTNDPQYGSPSFLSMPIFTGKKLAAIMHLSNKATGQIFDGNDEQVLFTIINELNLALENAMIHLGMEGHLRKIQQHNIELEKEVEAHKRTVRALYSSENKYRELFDFLPVAVFEIDNEGNVTLANRTSLECFGYTQNDIDGGLNALQMFIPEDIDRAKADIQKILNGEKTDDSRYTMLRKDGSAFPVLIFAGPITFMNTTVGFRGAVIDLTERKLAEDTLREREEKLRVILESVQVGIVIIDSETHTIIDANPAALNMFGAPKEQLLGSVCHNYICPAEKGRCPITDLGQTIDSSERLLLKADGKTLPIIKTVAVVTIDGKKQLLESFIDCSKFKQT